MHGIIFTELKKFVESNYGSATWTQLLKDAGLGVKLYMPVHDYPDADAIAIVTAASKATKMPPDQILEKFGEFIAPSLLGMYRTLIQPQWKTLDVLENTEETIHSVVRKRNPGAKPAEITAVRVGPNQVNLTYRSARKMCSVAKGIVHGMARHFGERVNIMELRCAHNGAADCQMIIKVI